MFVTQGNLFLASDRQIKFTKLKHEFGINYDHIKQFYFCKLHICLTKKLRNLIEHCHHCELYIHALEKLLAVIYHQLTYIFCYEFGIQGLISKVRLFYFFALITNFKGKYCKSGVFYEQSDVRVFINSRKKKCRKFEEEMCSLEHKIFLDTYLYYLLYVHTTAKRYYAYLI